jgi:N-ethylmaleimide reductase
VDIALKYFKPHQIGIKLSPTGRFNDMFDEHPVETYAYLLKQLDNRKIGFVELVESTGQESGPCADFFVPGKKQIADVCKTLRPYFKGVIIANNEFTPETGLKKMEEGSCDAVSFARLFITNPDLEQRIFKKAPLNTTYDFSTFYGAHLEDKTKGYTDYPALKE